MAGRWQPPTVRLRRLAGELRRLRAATGHTREGVEERTGINTATLYRIETARVRPQRRTLLALLDLYGVTDKGERDGLVELSRHAGQLGWLQPFETTISEPYQTYIGFESEAVRAHNYESLFVPGLLQTEEYARAVIRGVLPTATEADIEQRVVVRMRRQERLAGLDPIVLWAVIDEAVLRRAVGGDAVMREQLRHLHEAANEPHVTLQVVPFIAGAHPGMPGSFVVLDFPDPSDPAIVYTDSMAGDLFLEKESDVQRYHATFQQLIAQALSPADTAGMIREAVETP